MSSANTIIGNVFHSPQNFYFHNSQIVEIANQVFHSLVLQTFGYLETSNLIEPYNMYILFQLQVPVEVTGLFASLPK